MPGIPDNLHLRLRAALMDLDEFADNDTLRNVMQNSRLRPWRNRLRDTMNRATRAEGAVAYLQNQYTCDPRENALVILLRTLAGRREPENAEYLDLVALAAELECAQTGPVPIVATPSLSDEDRALVRDVLLRCDEFDSDAQLRTVLGGELLPFRDRMPEASTRVGRVEHAINYLQDKEVRGNRNALAVLLRALAGRYHPADTRAAALQRAALLVEFGGARAGELGSPSVGEETSMPTFDQRGQHVGQQYNVAGNLHIGTVQPRGADATRGTAGPPPVNVVIITPLEEERDAIRRWRPRYVWLVGIAGGLAKAGVALGDVLVADQIADNVIWKDATGKFFSYSLVSTYQLTPTEYSETMLFSILNDQIGGKDIVYDVSGKTQSVPVQVDGGRLQFKLPFDLPAVVFEGDKMTATAAGRFVDVWDKVD
jgi:hypothetical protein